MIKRKKNDEVKITIKYYSKGKKEYSFYANMVSLYNGLIVINVNPKKYKYTDIIENKMLLKMQSLTKLEDKMFSITFEQDNKTYSCENLTVGFKVLTKNLWDGYIYIDYNGSAFRETTFTLK